MTDREKIIEAVEEAFDIWIDEYEGTSYYNIDEVKNLKADALSLLKEQEPVEPELEGGGSSWWHVCGECHGSIDTSDRYCKHCGRRIKHEEKAK